MLYLLAGALLFSLGVAILIARAKLFSKFLDVLGSPDGVPRDPDKWDPPYN